jgi:hypothetical protein
MNISSKNLLSEAGSEKQERVLTTIAGGIMLQIINRAMEIVSPLNLNEIFGSLQTKPIC